VFRQGDVLVVPVADLPSVGSPSSPNRGVPAISPSDTKTHWRASIFIFACGNSSKKSMTRSASLWRSLTKMTGSE
jgi:hypothetical protein